MYDNWKGIVLWRWLTSQVHILRALSVSLALFAPAVSGLEEVKKQLESSLGPEEFQRKLSRAMSRVSESRSQGGSIADIVSALRSRSASVHSCNCLMLMRRGWNLDSVPFVVLERI
ncbi:hypothetical protein PR048_001202 [Dryococelus australis]|uniref:Uncharacterized protein n=1 Tax=Dryococelus australis TaxID=614101 RepID=A0ABQ9IGR0_9NEOP|nr:hypothetical protein PR048_001202 [Dryococelus australis]